jgi:hypothetical protein
VCPLALCIRQLKELAAAAAATNIIASEEAHCF